MITLEISLRHLAWSNQKFFSLFGEMPEEVSTLRSAENEWTVGELLEDEEIIFHAGGNPRSGTRSFILSQPSFHMSEHKGEIATILKQHGFHINLNELDVRSYVNETKLL